MTSVHALVVRYANPFALHVIVSSAVLMLAIAASYLPRLPARTRFAVLAAGVAKFLVPASLLAPFVSRSTAAAVIQMAIPRALPVTLQPPAAPAATPLDWVVVVAAAICVLFVAMTITSGVRAVAAAVRSALPAAPREVAALNAARKRIGVRHAVDLVRSLISEAPAVLRVLRPLIVLPADSADTLDDEELESLFCHECAHVARHDNLLALIEGVVRALFWFNPLIWFAHRRLAEEREKACDEMVADNAQHAETYAQALAKICQAILARPAAGVSCMASAHLKQRMEHIMRYRKSSGRVFWHFAITSAAVVFLLAAVAATAAISNGNTSNDDKPYNVTLKAGKIGKDLYGIRISACEKTSNIVAWASRPLKVKSGETFTAKGAAAVGNEPEISFRAEGRVDENGQVTAHVEVMRGTDVVQRITIAAVPKEADRYTGTPISMNLKDADLRDVLKTFASLTDLEIVPADGVEGKISVNLVNVPWDQALDQILKEHGYTWRLEGNKMTVSRL
jgi:beta-lactamase regulating signal transducer with metallopeptidase domain